MKHQIAYENKERRLPTKIIQYPLYETNARSAGGFMFLIMNLKILQYENY